ncbi:3-deoxy-D-manno-octulosonic acid transferase [Tellurirhabdus bombi]|uniref:3-deoxy-D-manno-octulosonic acid transferase n=1 Tax=Tellurirhabdus bombi TaxID=2907205 RepID=UPI001F43BED7|nr:glycosyltransferase N-terminal domain-containing protein [Tellurirhabdus bombi]
MFSLLYNTSIWLYGAAIRLAAPFHTKARQSAEGQRHLLASIQTRLAGNTAPVAWFHAASLGEFEQGRPVIEAFRERYPGYKILLTFFSPSGYEVRKNYAGADYIFYLPLDMPQNAKQFVGLVKPRIAFFVKYEFWLNYLQELHQRRVPTISFSAIFRPGQVFFKLYGGGYRKLLTYFDHILVQNQQSLDLLKGIGLTNLTLAGDTRFDRVAQIVANKKEIPVAQLFKGNQPLVVIGSAWQADLDVLIPFLNRFDQPLKVIIAPHEIHTDEIERWRGQLRGTSIRYSETQTSGFESASLASSTVLIIDNIGMLSSLYQYGDYAYVGGAFGKGLHNILEAATFGMPLFFGPSYQKFQEAIDLVQEGGAFPVADTAELEATFRRLYQDQAAHQKATEISRQYVLRNIGATGKVMEVIQDYSLID